MANQSIGGDKRIDRRTVLQVGTALAATGPLHGRYAEAQQRQPIIDCQVHAYAANTPERPWKIVPNWPDLPGSLRCVRSIGVDLAINDRLTLLCFSISSVQWPRGSQRCPDLQYGAPVDALVSAN